jgi:hypothetical protein
MYKIKDYSYKQADRLGVEIRPSANLKKKIDVFNKKGDKIASIGAKGYGDYPSYLEKNKKLAEQKREGYKARFKNSASVRGSPSYFASEILW